MATGYISNAKPSEQETEGLISGIMSGGVQSNISGFINSSLLNGGITQQIQKSIQDAKLPQVQLPDFSTMFNDITRSVGDQLMASINNQKVNFEYQSSGYKQTAQKAVNSAYSAISGASTGAVSATTGLLDKAKEAGTNIYNSITSGISNLFKWK